MPPVRDLTGQVFGRLTVLERATNSPQRRARWRCRCDCGREVIVLGSYLTSGDTQSCGCLYAEVTIAKGRARAIDLTGHIFGRLWVLGRASQPGPKGEVLWRCLCACGRWCPAVLGTLLRSGRTQSCGCLRDELQRERATRVGAAQRPKICRVCGRPYTAVGPQKNCSTACNQRWHARDELKRRGRQAAIKTAQDAADLAADLQRRLDRGQD